MKAALLIVVSLAALAYAGPATKNTYNNQIGNKQQQYMTTGDVKETQAIELLKQWCFSSQMTQPELTVSFKKLVSVIKSQPEDQSTEAAVMSERICQGALVQKSISDNSQAETLGAKGPDAQAHQLIKDVYMDALIACETRQCKQQLVKLIDLADEEKIDPIRAAYYMTRIAVTETESIAKESEVEIKQLVESLIKSANDVESIKSEAVERQKLFATTALISKALKSAELKKSTQVKQAAEQVAKLIVERFIKPVSQQEVQQYQQQQQQQSGEQMHTIAKKIARRNAALKALANIPGWIIKEIQEVEQVCREIAQNKQELTITRQSAIECLEENESVIDLLKQLTFDQQEPMEVRVAALRALMTSVYAGKIQTDSKRQQMATEIIEKVIKHCEESRNQQNDQQFVLYAISYLNNLRTSQQPENLAIRECIFKNKQHYMQIQLLNKKFQEQLSQITKSSRNYKLEQEFNQIESGLVLEGDLIYASKQHRESSFNVLPKLIRVNMSMPVMGETVNVVELTLRQDQMDEELLSAFKIAQSASFGSESVSKVVDSFKKSASDNKNKEIVADADLSIKIDGCHVMYVSIHDFKTESYKTNQQVRKTRSVESFIEQLIQELKHKPISFNRGFNFNINERLAKVLDVDANIIAGLRFDSRASGNSAEDFEIQAQIEPRFAFEAIVGPAKMTQKKLMQRVSTKTALGLRLRFKQNEIVDVQVDLPMNTMELFTVETQVVEKSATLEHSYNYLPESIYGQEDIYSLSPDRFYNNYYQQQHQDDFVRSNYKRSIFSKSQDSKTKQLAKLIAGKRAFAHSFETPEEFARATGLRGKLRMIASPKDMSFLVQVICEKYDQSMQGFRFQLQKVERSRDQQQYIVTVSTPGARTDRTMQVRLAVQSVANQRQLVKCEIQIPKMTISALYELVHDQRQYAIKTQVECNTKSRQLWRHSFECGVQRNSQAGSSRVASTYKPYLSIDSSELKRPVQLEGVISYQRTPKTVISYELKSSASSDFVQGKIILEQRQTSTSMGAYEKRTSSSRQMRSPIELIFNEQDVTMTAEMNFKIQEHTVKAHRMVEWNAAKKSLVSDCFTTYKNLRHPADEWQLVGSLKLDKYQQVFTYERRCPQQERKEFRLVLDSKLSQDYTQHQMITEWRYNGKSGQDMVAYKHKLDLAQWQLKQKNIALGYTVELVAVSGARRQVEEKFTGRTQVNWSRKNKTLKSEITSLKNQNKQAKLDVEFVSLDDHKIELVYQGEQVHHRCIVLSDERQLMIESRTEKRGLVLAKLNLKASKVTPVMCQIVVEVPVKRIQMVADLELVSGKTSSFAIKTGRFASKAEFSFDKLASSASRRYPQEWSALSYIARPFNSIQNLRFKSDLKDTMNQENYWIESQMNKMDKSYFRCDSPLYRTDLEYNPRESTVKFGSYGRQNKSPISTFYSNDDSLLNEPFSYLDNEDSTVADKKVNLADKLWMIRSAISTSPKEARRALFEYADKRQQHKHGLNWNDRDQRVKFNLNRQPMIDSDDSISPMKFTGDIATNNWFNNKNYKQQQQYDMKPSTLKMESDIVDFDFACKPYDGESAYAKVNALSRHPRSTFKKHDSEWTYNKQHGHKAWMKHMDSKNRRHQFDLEADQSPKKWMKMSYDSDKHGKAAYEHKWRKHLTKRSVLDSAMVRPGITFNTAALMGSPDDLFYDNQISFRGESPVWGTHDTTMQWVEAQAPRLIRRDVYNSRSNRFTNSLDYLKRVGARVQSQSQSPVEKQLYKLDFDFMPESYNTRLNLALPEEMLHESSFEYEPTQRTYKLHSKYSNLLNKQQPIYELLASTMRPLVSNLATANQEPVFIDESHPMLEQPISERLATKLFRQPLKLDYTDKFGRVAHFDYDQIAGAAQNYQNLRQKRATLQYKDDSMDFDHQSVFDFYPETFIGKVKPSYKKPSQTTSGDFAVKSETKYGPIMVHANFDDKNANFQVESPIVSVKLITEEGKRDVQVIKVQVDNKQQAVKLAKVLRQNLPLLADCPVVAEFVNKFDHTKFEHQTELLVSVVDSIFKLKSMTQMDKRPVLIVDGEYNKQQEKAYFKIDGERVKGQLIVDLNKQSAHLVASMNDKRTMHHETRVIRTSDKFFLVDSMTTYKQEPLFKLTAKVSSSVLSEPEHLFAARRSFSPSSTEEHVSTFDAIFFHPQQYQLSGKYDCLKKEAVVVVRDVEKRQTQEVRIVYDEQAENVHIQARSSSPRGIVKSMNKTFNVTPLIEAY